jgi:hypothetical protein
MLPLLKRSEVQYGIQDTHSIHGDRDGDGDARSATFSDTRGVLPAHPWNPPTKTENAARLSMAI